MVAGGIVAVGFHLCGGVAVLGLVQAIKAVVLVARQDRGLTRVAELADVTDAVT